MHLTPITKQDQKEEAVNLIASNNLPVQDIDPQTQLYAFMDQEKLIGTAALEIYEQHALVRSVSIEQGLQGKGLGKIMHRQLEQEARNKSISQLYLLTTTAEGFFKKEGFEVIQRNEVPESLQQSSEFKSTCPASATVMRKQLSNK